MPEEEKLKLGKGVAFFKARLKTLPRIDETWEADFRALPKPIMQTETHYLGIVITKNGGTVLASTTVHGRPSVNDLATLLANAMRRPSEGKARQPNLVRLRGHHQWRELFPVLNDLGAEVVVERELPGIEEAYRAHLQRLRDEHRIGMVKPSAEQVNAGATFPAIDKWVREFGWIEIGVQELFGFVVRASHEGGVQVEDTAPDTLAEALASLEAGLLRWFAEEGVELD